MIRRIAFATLAVALVLGSAGSANAFFGLLGGGCGGGCGCDSGCGYESSCGCEQSCGCDSCGGGGCGLFGGLRGLFHRHNDCGCGCESSCGCEEPRLRSAAVVVKRQAAVAKKQAAVASRAVAVSQAVVAVRAAASSTACSACSSGTIAVAVVATTTAAVATPVAAAVTRLSYAASRDPRTTSFRSAKTKHETNDSCPCGRSRFFVGSAAWASPWKCRSLCRAHARFGNRFARPVTVAAAQYLENLEIQGILQQASRRSRC